MSDRDERTNKPPPRQAARAARTAINRPLARPKSDARPEPHDGFELTTANVFVPPEEEEEYAYAEPIRPTPAPSADAASRRGLPVRVWIALGAVLAAGAAVAIVFLLSGSDPTFTAQLVNAPAGSKVFVDGVPSGVPQADGTILVKGLRAGGPRDVLVSREGYADWATTVTSAGGETRTLAVTMTPLPPPTPPRFPAEIDFGGKMVLIPAGEFVMGYDGGNKDEAPEHPVTLPDYYIDKYEVTNEQYARFCEETGHPKPANPFWDTQYFETNPRMPVIGVSYSDAEAYAAWAGKRLPTEAEWEKAASWAPGATAKRRYPWGDSEDQTFANTDSEHPEEVGGRPGGASAYGVHDMSGNAREWVAATYEAYEGNEASGAPFRRDWRVARGGDFHAKLGFASTTSRIGVDPTFKTSPGDDKIRRSSLVGFRCAASADAPKLKEFLRQ